MLNCIFINDVRISLSYKGKQNIRDGFQNEGQSENGKPTKKLTTIKMFNYMLIKVVRIS